MVHEWVGGIGLDERRWWMGFEILCNALPFIFFERHLVLLFPFHHIDIIYASLYRFGISVGMERGGWLGRIWPGYGYGIWLE
jgi:hypothetical protein